MTRPPLAVGARVRLSPDGPVYTVARVNSCAAYLQRGVPRVVTVMDRKSGEPRTFEATAVDRIAVSPYAAVYAVEEAPDDKRLTARNPRERVAP